MLVPSVQDRVLALGLGARRAREAAAEEARFEEATPGWPRRPPNMEWDNSGGFTGGGEDRGPTTAEVAALLARIVPERNVRIRVVARAGLLSVNRHAEGWLFAFRRDPEPYVGDSGYHYVPDPTIDDIVEGYMLRADGSCRKGSRVVKKADPLDVVNLTDFTRIDDTFDSSRSPWTLHSRVTWTLLEQMRERSLVWVAARSRHQGRRRRSGELLARVPARGGFVP